VGPEHIVARLKAIRDQRMRVLALIEAFREGDAGGWIETIAAIVARSHTIDDADAILAVQTITLAAGEEITCTFTNVVLGEGQITPTGTTCQDFVGGTSTDLPPLLAQLRGRRINNVAPGVYFYYAEVTKGAGQAVGFQQTVVATANAPGYPAYNVHQGQAFLYDAATCTRVATLTLSNGMWTGGAGLPAGDYILGVKFNTSAADGFQIAGGVQSGDLLATHTYQVTVGGVLAGSIASIETRKK
jgi:hypothetical protein